MAKLVFSKSKVLCLKNVLSKEYYLNNENDEKKNINMLASYIKSKNIDTYGPLIFYTSGIIGFNANKKPIVKNKIMIQCKQNNYLNIVSPYKFEGDIRIEDTLYVRFNDTEDKVFMASSKLLLYAYENDIDLEGGTYSIGLSEEKETKKVVLDLFMPIKKRTKL